MKNVKQTPGSRGLSTPATNSKVNGVRPSNNCKSYLSAGYGQTPRKTPTSERIGGKRLGISRSQDNITTVFSTKKSVTISDKHRPQNSLDIVGRTREDAPPSKGKGNLGTRLAARPAASANHRIRNIPKSGTSSSASEMRAADSASSLDREGSSSQPDSASTSRESLDKDKKAVAATKGRKGSQGDPKQLGATAEDGVQLKVQRQLEVHQELQNQLEVQQEFQNQLEVPQVQKDLQNQLEVQNKLMSDMEREKLILERQISELVQNAETRKTQIASFQLEIAQLKEQKPPPPELQERLQVLTSENQHLKERVQELVGSMIDRCGLSDTEKELLRARHKSSSAPPSILGHDSPSQTSGECFFVESTCATPERTLSEGSSVSEISVACLQDRIQQMEETHYSTNEELQATLQELTDLQDQLTDLQVENERLTEEKNVMLESLCRQTEKLEDCRSQIENMRQLLINKSENGASLNQTECEQKLLELLKSAQEEREMMILKQEELSAQLQQRQQVDADKERGTALLEDRIRLLESTVEAHSADKCLLEKQLAESREQNSSYQIEISRIKTLLENARAKVEELQQARDVGDKSELDELLDIVRREKDDLEQHVTSIQEQLSKSQCEVTRLKEQLSVMQEECKVTKNNAKKEISDLEYKAEQLLAEKQMATSDVQMLQQTVAELEVKCQHHLEDKRELKASLSESQKCVKEKTEKLEDMDRQLMEEKNKWQEESDEWKQFQSDLLVTVRVANDLKTEAQQDLEKIITENHSLKDQIKNKQLEVDKLKASQAATVPPKEPLPALQQNTQHSLIKSDNGIVGSVQQQEITRRQKFGSSRTESRLSVKNLIESLERDAKQAKQGPGSQSSSTSSLNSITSDLNQPPPSTTALPTLRRTETDIYIKTPLREQKQITNQPLKAINRHTVPDGLNNRTNISDSLKCNTGKPTSDEIKPINPVSILSYKMDFTRRNSYSDIGEKKDPLASLVKNGGSKRNALLKWCQNKAIGYQGVEITNFSSSWNDGMAFCALLHSYLPEKIPYDTLNSAEKRRNFTIAFEAAESVGIPTILKISDMILLERPDWQQIMTYVTSIYKHFET